MDQNDRQAIEGLFGKLSQVEQQAGPRDDEAEAFIKQRVASQPAAPYFMAQTIVVQEQALGQAQQRIEELEYQMSQRPSGGGLFSGLFGGGAQPQPRRPAAPAPMRGPAAGQAGGPWGQQGQGFGQQRGGGGFLAGAAQTAMGVAGGMLLGSAISGMFAGDAEAAEPEPAADEPDTGGGGDMGDMEF